MQVRILTPFLLLLLLTACSHPTNLCEEGYWPKGYEFYQKVSGGSHDPVCAAPLIKYTHKLSPAPGESPHQLEITPQEGWLKLTICGTEQAFSSGDHFTGKENQFLGQTADKRDNIVMLMDIKYYRNGTPYYNLPGESSFHISDLNEARETISGEMTFSYYENSDPKISELKEFTLTMKDVQYNYFEY